jgi:hypothetical protein
MDKPRGVLVGALNLPEFLFKKSFLASIFVKKYHFKFFWNENSLSFFFFFFLKKKEAKF